MDEAIACNSGRTFASRMSRSVVAMFTFPVGGMRRLTLEPASRGEPPGCRALKWAPGRRRRVEKLASLLILFPSTGPGGAAHAASRELKASDHVTRSTARTELVLVVVVVVPPLAG